MLLLSEKYKSLMGYHWIYVIDKNTSKEVCRYRRLKSTNFFWEKILEKLEKESIDEAKKLYEKYRKENIPIFIIWR